VLILNCQDWKAKNQKKKNCKQKKFKKKTTKKNILKNCFQTKNEKLFIKNFNFDKKKFEYFGKNFKKLCAKKKQSKPKHLTSLI
jgi:hypothetical protein